MNGTSIIYNSGQQAVLPLLGGILAPLMSWGVFVYAKRRLGQKETPKSRAYLFYRVISGVLLGQAICHSFVTDSPIISVRYLFSFLVVGYLCMVTAEDIARVWNTNRNYTGPNDDTVREDVALNREEVTVETFVVVDAISSNGFSDRMWTIEDKEKDERRRLWLLGVLFTVFAVITTMDGLILVYRNPQSEGLIAGIIVCYYINGIVMSIAVYGAMLHAKIHLLEEKRTRLFWWCTLTALWCVILIASSFYVLVGLQVTTVASIVNNPALVSFYGFAAGCILRLQQYFFNMKMDQMELRDLLMGLGVFLLTAGQSIATAMWL